MDDSLLSRAFDVNEITNNFTPELPPSTGHEYLQYVMYEASKCPQVVVAEIDKSKIKNHVNIDLETNKITGVNELVPSIEWQHKQVAIFSELRKRVEACKKSNKFVPVALPDSRDKEKWRNICIGNENLQPGLTLMLSMNEPFLERVLEYQYEWLEEEGWKPNQGKWIYALLACLSLPLTSDVCSTLRDLARQCAKLKLYKDSLEEDEVVALNIIICLVCKYFGQTDLID